MGAFKTKRGRNGTEYPALGRPGGDCARLSLGRRALPTGPGGAHQGGEGVRWDGQGDAGTVGRSPTATRREEGFADIAAPDLPTFADAGGWTGVGGGRVGAEVLFIKPDGRYPF